MQEYSPADDKADTVAQLRDVFRLTGVIQEMQVRNLRIWPVLAFPMCRSVTTNIDLDKRSITFELLLSKGRRLPDDVRARGKGLHRSVQYLLGKDFEIRILNGKGKAIFYGKRSEPLKTYEGTDFEAGRIVPTTPWKFPTKS